MHCDSTQQAIAMRATGRLALYLNTTGSNNSAVRFGSLVQSNTTASNNTAIGYQAGHGNTTGSNNTALGNGAFYTNTIRRSTTPQSVREPQAVAHRQTT